MILTELIREQVLQVTVMFGAGIGAAFFYQIVQILLRELSIVNLWRSVIEILFWMLIAIWVRKFLYYCAYGQLSVHAAAGFCAGALLWKISFCDIINQICINAKTRRGKIKNHGEKEKKQSV